MKALLDQLPPASVDLVLARAIDPARIPDISPSSWMATDAGPGSATIRARPAIEPVCRTMRETVETTRAILDYQKRDRRFGGLGEPEEPLFETVSVPALVR
jgi:hypothetical protein